MKTQNSIAAILLMIGMVFSSCAQKSLYNNDDFKISSVQVTHEADLAVTVWEIMVVGTAGNTVPDPAGQLDGAPVLGYVFPTSL